MNYELCTRGKSGRTFDLVDRVIITGCKFFDANKMLHFTRSYPGNSLKEFKFQQSFQTFKDLGA